MSTRWFDDGFYLDRDTMQFVLVYGVEDVKRDGMWIINTWNVQTEEFGSVMHRGLTLARKYVAVDEEKVMTVVAGKTLSAVKSILSELREKVAELEAIEKCANDLASSVGIDLQEKKE